MAHLVKILSLLVVLLVAQQGAVGHEVGHLANARATIVHAALVDSSCPLCPAFAQVVTPAFSHAFQLPQLIQISLERLSALASALITSTALDPRSRGPPA